jgi:hypothetical protein
VLLCHADEPLHTEGLAQWLGSWTDLKALVVIEDPASARWRRLRGEWRRSGLTGVIDVALFQLWYRIAWRQRDRAWHKRAVTELAGRFPPVAPGLQRLAVRTPNSPEVRALLEREQPDLMLALCKHILKPEIFSVPRLGTFVMHPGTCPEYRNAHGCFWALVNGDPTKAGMTLLRVDAGVDTGPVYGYFTYPFDEASESHVRIQHRVVLDNLDGVKRRLEELAAGTAIPIRTAGRPSGFWGQPRMSSYLKWRRRVRSMGHAHTGS